MITRIKKHYISLVGLILFWLFVILSETPFHSVGEHSIGTFISNIILLLIIGSSFFVVLLCDGSLSKNYLCIALLLGIYFVFLRPFSSSIDESYHFMRSFELSTGKLFPNSLGICVPEGYQQYAKEEFWNAANVLDEPLWLEPVTAYEFFPRVRSASYLFFQYIPGAIGIGIARLLRLPLIGIVLMGRLFFYLYYVVVCFLAMKKTDTLKSLVFLVSLSGGIALMYGLIQPDLVLVSTCLLFISICLHYCFDDVKGNRISNIDLLLLGASSLVLSSIKYCGYAPIILLCLFIPKHKYENRKSAISIVLFCFSAVLVLQVFALIRYRGSLGELPQGVSMTEQIKYMARHPVNAMRVIGGDMVGTSFERILRQRETSRTAIDAIANGYALFPVIGAILAKDRPELASIQNPNRFLMVSLILACFMQLTICISLYVDWTVVGSNHISGVHPRYTLPFLILCLIPFSFLRIKNSVGKWEEFLSICSVICLLNTLVSLF